MMSNTENIKRVFFAFEVVSPWPESLPEGRLLKEGCRHMTIAFIGSVNYPELEKILPAFPPPQLKVGIVGKFNKILFLPRKRPNVVAWHVDWLGDPFDFSLYQKEVADWLGSANFEVRLHKEGFLSHVTLARRPFRYQDWREIFKPLPLFIKNIHLYESAGNLDYVPLWSYALLAPFKYDEEALTIQGDSLDRLYRNALIALAFSYPKLLSWLLEIPEVKKPGELFIALDAFLEKLSRKGKIPFRTWKEIETPKQDPEGIWSWKLSVHPCEISKTDYS